jgi:hypothetical protein
MDKFEHVVVVRDLNQAGTGFLEELNKLGEDGWETVCALQPSMVGFEYILMKRKKKGWE